MAHVHTEVGGAITTEYTMIQSTVHREDYGNDNGSLPLVRAERTGIQNE